MLTVKGFKQLPSASLLLRLGLAFIFLYASIAAFINPNEWVGYLPPMLTSHLSATMLLKLFSLGELILAFWLLSGIYVRFAALAATAMLVGITLSNLSILVVTFRDVGLIFAALALAVMDEEKPTKKPEKQDTFLADLEK